MSDPLEDRIRRGADAMYESSTPVEDLVPPELADKAGKPQPDLVATRLRPPSRTPLHPSWAIAVVATAAVLLMAVPLLLLTGTDTDEADIAAPNSFTRYNVDVTAHFEDNGATVVLEAHGNDLEGWPATLKVNLDLDDGVNDPCSIIEADYDFTDNGDDTITIQIADNCGSVIEDPFDIVVVYEPSRFHSQDIEDGLMCTTTGVAEFNQDNQGADVIITEIGVEAPMVADYKALIERCQPVGSPAT